MGKKLNRQRRQSGVRSSATYRSQLNSLTPSLGNSRRGFTLIELMVVVVLMGVLAALGTVSFRSQMTRAKNTEGLSMLTSISAAQESFFADNRIYLDVTDNINTLSEYYPPGTEGSVQRTFWGYTGAQAERWQRLAPEAPQLVRYRYATIAGLPFEQPPSLSNVTVTWPAATAVTSPWYVVAATGDVDDDGKKNYMVVTSFSSNVHQTNVGE